MHPGCIVHPSKFIYIQCGTIIFQYYNRVSLLFPTTVKSSVFVVQCSVVPRWLDCSRLSWNAISLSLLIAPTYSPYLQPLLTASTYSLSRERQVSIVQELRSDDGMRGRKVSCLESSTIYLYRVPGNKFLFFFYCFLFVLQFLSSIVLLMIISELFLFSHVCSCFRVQS